MDRSGDRLVDENDCVGDSQGMKPDHNQLRAARLALKLTIQETAAAVGAGRSQVVFLEDSVGLDQDLVERLATFYRASGVVFREDGTIEVITPLFVASDTTH